MRVVGIIAEYNPFHNGHEYHMKESLRLSEADYTVVAMSGNFVQRGAPAMMDKHTRAEAALRCGADLVLEIPVLYAAASAEYFAGGAAALLDSLGVVTHLSFGSECGNLEPLQNAAEILTREPEDYRAALKAHLKQGFSYPAARAQALAECCPNAGNFAEFLSSPNNILAVDYIKALIKRGSGMVPVTVKRTGAGYHETADHEAGCREAADYEARCREAADYEASSPSPISAEAIRRILYKENRPQELFRHIEESGLLAFRHMEKSGPQEFRHMEKSGLLAFPPMWKSGPQEFRPMEESGLLALLRHMPEAAGRLLCSYLAGHRAVRSNDFSGMLYYRLLTEREQGFGKYLDVSPGLSDRIGNRLGEFTCWEDFCSLLKTKDLTYTRVSRCLLHILLGIEKEQMARAKAMDHAPYARVLGLRRSAGPLLHAVKEHSSIPLITKMADAEKSLSADAYRLLQLDIRSSGLYYGAQTGFSGTPVRNEISTPPVLV